MALSATVEWIGFVLIVAAAFCLWWCYNWRLLAVTLKLVGKRKVQ